MQVGDAQARLATVIARDHHVYRALESLGTALDPNGSLLAILVMFRGAVWSAIMTSTCCLPRRKQWAGAPLSMECSIS